MMHKKISRLYYDLITTEILNQLSKTYRTSDPHIFNSVLRLPYFPVLWKYSTVLL